MQELEDVREHAHGRDLRTGAWSLNDHRCVGVSLRRERDDVVAAFRFGQRVVARYFLQLRARDAVLEHANVAQHVAARSRRLEALRQVAIERREG